MDITTELAQPIVQRLIPLVEYNINIMNAEGMIVASGDRSRIGQRHAGAIEVLRTSEAVIIPIEANPMTGTKPGVNLPIQFADQIIGVVGITGAPKEVHRFASMVKMSVEVLLEQIDMQKQLHYRQQQLNAWMVDLVYQETLSPEKLQQSAERIGFDPHLPRHIFMVKTDEGKYLLPSGEMFSLLQKEIPWPDTLCAELRGNLFLLAIPSGQSLLQEKIDWIHHRLHQRGISARIGVGKARSTVNGYRQSAKQAEQSLRLQHQLQVNHPSYIEEWGITRLIEAIPTEIRNDFLASYEEAWTELDQEFIDTLQVFLHSHLQVKETAQELHIHRNTLLYRLQRITEVFQHNPRYLDDAVTLQILLLCKRLRDCAK